MISPNKAARDYQWEIAHSATYDLHTGVGHVASSLCQITYGNEWQEFVHGIQMYAQNFRDAGGTETFSYYLKTPWGEFSASESDWQNRSLKLEMDDVVLQVTTDCLWTLSFSELRFYIDDEMGGWLLKHTITAQEDNDDEFDHRLNHTYLDSNSGLDSIVTPMEGVGCTNTIDCLDDWNGTDAYLVETAATTNGGWRWKLPEEEEWTEDTVRILPISPPDLDCACAAQMGDITFDVDEHSDNITLTSLYSFEFAKEFGCTYDCVYSDVPCTDTFEDWYLSETWINKNSSINAVHIAAPMEDHRAIGTAECGATEEEDIVDSTQSDALSEYVKTGLHWNCTITCTKLTSGTPCIPGLEPPVCGSDCPITVSCFNKLQVESQWPTLPPCTGEVSNPWNLESAIGQYHRTDIVDGDVWYRRATYSAPFGGFEQQSQVTTTGNCSHPRMEEDHRPVLYLTYVKGSAGIQVRRSFDEGTSFGDEEVLIANAYFGTIAHDPIGTLVALGFVYNSGTSGPGKIYMRRKGPGDTDWSASAAIQSGGSDMEFEEGTFHISYDNQGPGRWVLVCKISGETDLSEWYSTDECETFKEVA